MKNQMNPLVQPAGCVAMEQLENRRLLSVTLAESEPNNSRANADVIARMPDTDVAVTGQLSTLGDRDWFGIQLQPGDVIGAAMNGQDGLDTVLRLVNGSGKTLLAGDDSQPGAVFLPPESPLPRNQGVVQNAEIYYVIKEAGTYYLEVAAFENDTTGRYDLNLRVARPGMETRPAGSRQVLYLDFDGAKVDFSTFSDLHDSGVGATHVLPISRFLAEWGLSKSDENSVIDLVVAEVTEILSTHVAANGENDQFGIDIRHSRNDADKFGTNLLVSRVAVGIVKEFAALGMDGGTAEFIDVGNFKHDDQAVAHLGYMVGAINAIGTDPSKTRIQFVAHAISLTIAHEAGHIFGCFHTDQPSPFEGTPNIMDLTSVTAVGPDFVYGTADDIDLRFGVDGYEAVGIINGGVNDTLTTVSFGLSTGLGAAAKSAAFSVVGIGRSGSLFATTSANSPSAFDSLDVEDELAEL